MGENRDDATKKLKKKHTNTKRKKNATEILFDFIACIYSYYRLNTITIQNSLFNK